MSRVPGSRRSIFSFDLREGTDELYDLDRDPNEQYNLAQTEPERGARLRQRLAAWTEANRRQYERASAPERTVTPGATRP